MITINALWNSTDENDWQLALQRYWDFVKQENIALEQRMEKLAPDDLSRLDAQAWYEFLRDEYFRWKYTANHRYATTTIKLCQYVNSDTLDQLHNIKERLLSLDPRNIGGGLATAQEIHGLGCAGASGLLALLYPTTFGTVDQFVVKALRDIENLPEANALRTMNEASLTTKNGVLLIQIMQRKAELLNQAFGSTAWSPRKVDMVLWTFGRSDDLPSARAHTPTSMSATHPPRTGVLKHDSHHKLPISNHSMIASAVASHRGKTLTTSEIKIAVLEAFPDFAEGSLLPNDHASGNKSPCRCATTEKRIFDRVEQGRYFVR